MRRLLAILTALLVGSLFIIAARADFIIVVADLTPKKSEGSGPKGSSSASSSNPGPAPVQPSPQGGGTTFAGGGPQAGMPGAGMPGGGMMPGGMMPGGRMGGMPGMGMPGGGMGMGGASMGGMPGGGRGGMPPGMGGRGGAGGMPMGGMGAGGMGPGAMGPGGMGQGGMGRGGMGAGGMAAGGMGGMGMGGMRPGGGMGVAGMPAMPYGGNVPSGLVTGGGRPTDPAAPGDPGVVSSGSGTNPFADRIELPGSVEVYVPPPIRIVTVVEVDSRVEKELKLDGKKEKVPYITHGLSPDGKGATYLFKGEFVDWMPLDESKAYPTLRKLYSEKRKAIDAAPKSAEGILDFAEWALQHRMLKEFAGLMNELGTLKSDHPSYKAFVEVEKALSKAVPDDGKELNRWKEAYIEYKLDLKPGGHYALLHNLGDNSQRNVKTRREYLEESFKLFYYWFALRGISDIELPKERLVSMLESERATFKKRWLQLEPAPLVVDGFYCRDLNLLVFSKDSQDELRRSIADITYALVGKSEDALLHGPEPDSKKPEITPENQTIALLVRALERDSELSSTSYGVTRQLLLASGLLPRGLAAPEWIQSGMATFFEVPRGSAWPVCASGHSVYLPQFQDWAGANSQFDPSVELENVITDRTFRQAEGAKDSVGHFKARTMAWALSYYLAQRYPNELRAYFKGLAALPRDLELDRATLLRVFAKAFKLMDDKKANEISKTKFDSLARSWCNTMRGVRLEADDIVRTQQKLENDPNLPLFKNSESK